MPYPNNIAATLTATEIIDRFTMIVGDINSVKTTLTKQILDEVGEVRFWRVAMKPGKPQAFGLARGKPVFGLPGNPVSSMVVFDQFVRPALLKMAGHRRLQRMRLRAVVDETIRKPPGKVHFMRAIIEERDGALHARGPAGRFPPGVSSLPRGCRQSRLRMARLLRRTPAGLANRLVPC